jgi:hypothetical protein
MTTRRNFLKVATGAAGVAFCSCAMLDGARAQQASGQRLPIMMNGKRVKNRRACALPLSRGGKADGERQRGIHGDG